MRRRGPRAPRPPSHVTTQLARTPNYPPRPLRRLIGEADGSLALFHADLYGNHAAVPAGLSAVGLVAVGADAAPAVGDVTGDGLPDLVRRAPSRARSAAARSTARST